MSRTFRHDRGELPRPVRRPDGSIVFSAHVARTGRHVYTHGDEHRDRAELERIVAQLAGKPITVDHDGFCRAGACTIVGRVERAWLDGDHAAAEMRIDDRQTADLIMAGKREVSLGYFAEVVDGWQRDIDVDHVSIVDVGRCGPTCAIRADGQEMKMACCNENRTDAELRNLAREINVPRYDDVTDERELALAVLKHCGIDVRRPYLDHRTIPIEKEHPVYIAGIAKGAAQRRLRGMYERLGVRTDGARGERFDDPRTDADRRLDARTVADAKRRAHLQSLHVDAEYRGEHEQALYRRHIEQAVAEQGRRGHVDSPRGSSSRDRAYAAYAEHNRNAWRRPTEDSTDE